MPKGLPKVVTTHLEKAKESAVAAVDCYNRCGTRFRSGSYIVLMCIAWTSLFHAIFFKRKVKPFYRESEGSKRFKKIDGDYKAWELMTCVEKYYPGQTNPISENLRFLVGLRNKIEHRSMPELDNHIFGECQACLFNFEDILFKEFGAKHCLSECLSLAIQFSKRRSDIQGMAISELHKPLRADIRKYIDTFRSSLSNRMSEDLRFSYKVFLIPKVANSQGQADVAVEFVKFDPTKPEEMIQYEKLAAIIKPAVSQVVNAGRFKAGDVCKRIEPIVKQCCGKHCSTVGRTRLLLDDKGPQHSSQRSSGCYGSAACHLSRPVRLLPIRWSVERTVEENNCRLFLSGRRGILDRCYVQGGVRNNAAEQRRLHRWLRFGAPLSDAADSP